MGIVQDTLCGICKFTLRDCFMDWATVQNILLCVPGWDGTVPTPTIIAPKPVDREADSQLSDPQASTLSANLNPLHQTLLLMTAC